MRLLLRLTRENEELKSRLYHIERKEPPATAALASGNDSVTIVFYFERQALNSETGRYKKIGVAFDTIEMTWNEVFRVISPNILTPQRGYWNRDAGLDEILASQAQSSLAKKYQNEKFSGFHVERACRQTINLQFRALGLIAMSEDGGWELTPYGDEYMTQLFTVPKGKSASQLQRGI